MPPHVPGSGVRRSGMHVLDGLTEGSRGRSLDAEVQLRGLLAHAPVGLFVLDAAANFVLCEGRALDAMGLRAREAVGRAALEVLSDVHWEMPPGVDATVDDVVSRALIGEEVVCTARLGPSWFDVRLTPLPMPHGPDGVLGVCIDVTTHRQLQARLAQADRLVVGGLLAAGVAHEVNNPLTYILLHAEYIARELRATARDAADGRPSASGAALAERLGGLTIPLRTVFEGAERIREVVRNLRTFASAQPDRRAPLDVRAVLDNAIEMANHEIRHRARLVRLYEDVPLVFANEQQLGTVFLHLLVNAARAIPEGRADQNEVGVAVRADDGGRIVVEIRDTGTGIDAPTLRRVFDPFFTTGTGVGLGLSVCHGVVSALGGELEAESEPGAGSLFRVRLPSAPFAEPAGEPVLRPLAKARASVLVVDDDALVAQSLAMMLRDEHEVRVAHSAREVLDLVARGERFDVILCDVTMPVVTGPDLHRELLRRDPQQAARVVFVTGGAFTDAARAYLARTSNRCIDKPPDPDDLLRVVREAAGIAG